MDIWDVMKIVRKGGYYLGESLWEYWPSKGNNEVPEANVTLHVGRALAEAGFAVFAEAHGEDSGTDKRHDLLAYSRPANTVVACEFKRLYSGEKANQMLHDVRRLGAFRPIDNEVANSEQFGVLAATTWDVEYARWWVHGGGDRFLKGAWAGFDKETVLKDAQWGTLVLQAVEDWAEPNAKWHYFLYAVFPLRA